MQKNYKLQTMKTKTNNLFATATLALCGMLLLVPHGMAADKDTLNATDVKFVKHEAAAGMAVVKLAELGVKKAANPDVKALAETIVAEHTKANEELAGLAKTKGVELSAMIDPADAGDFQKLEKSSGPEFDKEFLAQLTSGHKKCVSNFEAASKDAKDSDLKAWVDKMIPALKAHLEKVTALASK
jgi:putative membrane protein